MLTAIMKLNNFSKLFFVAFLVSIALFANASSVLAGNAPTVFHEADSGKTIKLGVGQIVKFSFAENQSTTSTWLCSFAYQPALPPLVITDAAPVYDVTQNPRVLTATTYSCFGESEGNAIIYFCQQDENGNYINSLIFSVIVTPAEQ